MLSLSHKLFLASYTGHNNTSSEISYGNNSLSISYLTSTEEQEQILISLLQGVKRNQIHYLTSVYPHLPKCLLLRYMKASIFISIQDTFGKPCLRYQTDQNQCCHLLADLYLYLIMKFLKNSMIISPPPPPSLLICLDDINLTFGYIACQRNESIVQMAEHSKNILKMKGLFVYVLRIYYESVTYFIC